VSQLLILVRHGVTDWNREGRFQGRLDPPLSDVGKGETSLLAERLAADPSLRPRRLVTSPLARATMTASIIAEALGGDPRPEPEPRLVEIGQGAWEGHTHAELAITAADDYAAWRRDEAAHPPPGGEPIDGVVKRVGAALADLVAADRWPLAVVSHGGALRIAGHLLLGIGLDRAWHMDQDNAGLSVLSRRSAGDAWRVERWNDAGHLLGRVPLHVDEAEGEPLAL
jgi:broad specificity phosphatase PhoE